MLVIVLAFALAAPAQSPTENEKDIRCAIAASSLRLESATTAEQQNALMAIMSFYVGRLSARLSPQEIEALFNRDFGKVKPEERDAITKGCAREMLRYSNPG